MNNENVEKEFYESLSDIIEDGNEFGDSISINIGATVSIDIKGNYAIDDLERILKAMVDADSKKWK